MQSTLKKNGDKRIKLYLLWGLISIELLMSFSFLGYIHVEPLSVTIVYIPVLLAGCLIGPWESALVGLVFGLASMWKASAFYVNVGDMMFSPVMSGKPIQSILLSAGSRALFGLAVGVLYSLAKRSKRPMAGILIVSSFGRLIHSVLVYTFMGALFPEAGFTAEDAFAGLFRLDNILLLAIQDLVVAFCWILQNSSLARKLGDRLRMVERMAINPQNHRKTVAAVIILTLFASFSVALYFTNRLRTVLSGHGVWLSEEISYDIVHIQIQFLLGLTSLFSVIILVVVLGLKTFNYLYYYEAKIDELTGISGRSQFFLLGAALLEKMEEQPGKSGYFLILDVDHFKRINDQLGHPAGDMVLSEVAGSLKDVFRGKGLVGRLGGDEFVVLIHQPVSKNGLQDMLKQFEEKLAEIDVAGNPVTCSIGIVPVWKGSILEESYRSADGRLYRAKREKMDR